MKLILNGFEDLPNTGFINNLLLQKGIIDKNQSRFLHENRNQFTSLMSYMFSNTNIQFVSTTYNDGRIIIHDFVVGISFLEQVLSGAYSQYIIATNDENIRQHEQIVELQRKLIKAEMSQIGFDLNQQELGKLVLN